MKRLSARDRQRLAASNAMPDVKKLVRRHGRAAVSNCLTKIYAAERAARKVAVMRKELVELEKRLSP